MSSHPLSYPTAMGTAFAAGSPSLNKRQGGVNLGPPTVFTITTTGAGSMVVPAGKTFMKARSYGPGGSGGGAASDFGGGGAGGGYDESDMVPVTPGDTIYYFVAPGVTGTTANGTQGSNSWVNKGVNAQPVSSATGCVATGGAGGKGNSAGGGTAAGGTGLLSATKAHTGGTGANGSSANLRGGGGGGGAGSGGDGGAGSQLAGSSPGGVGGTPDGGAGGDGGASAAVAGTAPGGGGGGAWSGGSVGGNGARGQVEIDLYAPA